MESTVSPRAEESESYGLTTGEVMARIPGIETLDKASFEQIASVLPVAIYTTDAEGRLTYFNDAAVRLAGRRPQLGADRWSIPAKMFLPDGTPLPANECPLAMVLRGAEAPPGMELIGERPDGTRYWFVPSPTAIRDTQGRIIGAVNILTEISARKTAEMEAREQFRGIVQTTQECVKLVDSDGSLLFMNQAGLSMIGASSADAVVGKNVLDLVSPEDRERFREFNKRICAGERGTLEFDIVGFSGNRRRMESHAAPLQYADGRTVQLAISRDISERQRGERSALLLSAIVDSSDDAIISKDLNGIVTSWNKGAERLFGYTAQEMIGQPITTVIPPERLDEEPVILSKLRRGERIEHFETIRRHKDGTLLNISLSISPVKDAHGVIIGASKIARDITDRKRAEAALIATEARFRQLADAMPHMVWTARPDGSVDYFNERWYAFTGLDRFKFGEEGWSIVHPEDVAHTRTAWEHAIASGEPFKVEYRLWDRNQHRWRWFIANALAARDAAGNIIKWFGSCADIDDQKRVEDDLRRVNSDLEQFAYSASHDLQEPLRSVKIYSELLTENLGDQIGPEAREFLRYVRSGASRMEMLVRDLLTYTQETKFDPVLSSADAGEALRNALSNLAAIIAETHATVTGGELPVVNVHTTHLQQLFQNLIGNAIKYRDLQRPPVVNVSAERQNAFWVFSVSDNGIGIEPEYKERIFGLFKRLHNSDQYSGTGIGLAICKRIVDRYHGRIWVESEPGTGSTFRFQIPV